MELIIEDQHQGTAGSTKGIGKGSLEKGLGAFIDENLFPAIDRSIVELFLSSSLHHDATTDRVKGIAYDAGGRGDALGNDPAEDDGWILGILQQQTLGSVKAAEKCRPIDNDSSYADSKASVEATQSGLFVNRRYAVGQTGELSSLARAHIGSQTRAGKIQRIYKEQAGGTGGSTRGQIAGEKFPKVCLGIMTDKDLFVLVLEGEIQGLSGKVANYIGQIAPPIQVSWPTTW